MAERSKAADLSSVIFGCVGSNPTSGNFYYTFLLLHSYVKNKKKEMWVRSSVVEHGIADPMVAGSIPVTPFCFVHDIYIYQQKK